MDEIIYSGDIYICIYDGENIVSSKVMLGNSTAMYTQDNKIISIFCAL